MKIAFIIVIICLFLLGCSKPQEASHSVSIDNCWTIGDCCGGSAANYYVEASGTASENGSWLSLRLLQNGRSIKGTTNPQYVTGSFYAETLFIQISFFDTSITAGSCELELESIATHSTDSIRYTSDYVPITHYGLSDPQCNNCCTNFSNERYFAGLHLWVDDITGISANIEAVIGLPCGYASGITSDAFLSSHVMVMYDTLLENSEFPGVPFC